MGARGARGSVRRCGQTERMLVQDTVTDERVVVLTPDKDGYTHTSRGRVAVLAARRGTVCGEVGRVLRFASRSTPASSPPLSPSGSAPHMAMRARRRRAA